MKHPYAILFFFLLTCAGPGIAQSLPTGGTRLVEETRLAPDKLHVRLGGGKFGTKETLPSGRTDFERALRVHVARQPPNTWDAGIGMKITAPVKKGDALLFGFWARGQAADGNGGAVAEFVFERAGNPYTKSVQYLVETPDDGSWRHFWIRCKSLEDYAPDRATLNFQAGYLPATLELGGLEAWNFGDRVPLKNLPYTPLTYVGREEDAAWRAEAEKLIDQHRKGNITVTVVGPGGRPRAGIPVHLKLDRLAFDFGSAVRASMLTGDGADKDMYRKVFKNTFNLGVIENGLKWRLWDLLPREQGQTIEALRWLERQGIPARGHVLVWPGWRHLPKWLEPLKENPDELRKVIDDHIREVGRAAGGLVRDWDVLNEVYANRDLTNLLGDREMVHWFKEARKAAPKARLYYNDYAGLVRGGFPTSHKDHFEKTLRFLIDHGAPIDGMGIQGHFGSLLTPPRRLYAELDRWAALGLDILITEFDVTVPDEKLRADFTRDFLTVCFSHPGVIGIVSWGFWEKMHWKPDAAFFAKDWSVTPMGREWIRLTRKTWTTDETGITDAKGQVKIRGFLGDYTVASGKVQTSFKLETPGRHIRLTIEP
jgi:GH35 family endo-1,4-beta-xylanase